MKTYALFITLISITASACAGIVAGPFTNSANGHLYYLLTSDTWTNSEAEAVALGGHLATINDAAENQWVVDTFALYGGVERPLWIGLTDRDREGRFQWVSGELFNFANWNLASGEPNNSGGSGYEENFTYIIQQNSGNPTVFATFWNDVPNDGYGVIPPIYGVAEVNPLVPVPVPFVRDEQVCWATVSGAAYQAQWKPATSRGTWIDYGPIVIGNGDEVCVSGAPRPGPNRLYRVLVLD
jgi:hypothetical protein